MVWYNMNLLRRDVEAGCESAKIDSQFDSYTDEQQWTRADTQEHVKLPTPGKKRKQEGSSRCAKTRKLLFHPTCLIPSWEVEYKVDQLCYL